MNQNKGEKNIEKLYKRATWYAVAVIFSFIGLLVSAIFIGELSDKVDLVGTIILLMIMAICIGATILSIIFLALTFRKICKEEDEVQESKIRKLGYSIGLLGPSDFKEIKIKNTNVFLNTFLKKSKIEAKFDEDNDNIVIVKISMLDEEQKNSFTKEYFFSREDIKSILEEVI